MSPCRGPPDGIQPWAGLISDRSGNLYGVTTGGGSLTTNCGTVFELTPAGGIWSETILHVFTCQSDGWFPTGDLVLDKAGNLYGATQWAGTGCGSQGCG